MNREKRQEILNLLDVRRPSTVILNQSITTSSNFVTKHILVHVTFIKK